MPRIWPMVITPVPPMPVTRMPKGASRGIAFGSSRGKTYSVEAAVDFPFFRRPPSTVTKLGQKPFTQE